MVGWQRPLVGAELCALSALTQAVPAVTVEADVRSAAMSLAAVGFVAFAAVGLVWQPIKGDDKLGGHAIGRPPRSAQ